MKYGSTGRKSGEFAATRRDLLLGIGPAAAAGAVAAMSGGAHAQDMPVELAEPDLEALAALEGDALWAAVRDQYDLSSGIIPFNSANMCPPCLGVRLALAAGTKTIDADPSFENRRTLSPATQATRQGLATMIGADLDEIAITRNTTESNNTIVTGLDLGPGDEVVIWDSNHESNLDAWDLRAKRAGFTVVKVALPIQPETDEDLLAPFREAITENTKVVAFSHVSNHDGTMVPAKALCAMAHDAGALALADGAQSFGAGAIDVHDMGCDFFTGSGQKWPSGPREAGLLYVRKEIQDRLWPAMVSSGWGPAEQVGASSFDNLGQRDDAAVAAFGAAVALHNAIGKERVQARVRAQAGRLMDLIEERIPGTVFLTPRKPEYHLGVVVFDLHADSGEVSRRLYQDYQVSGAVFAGTPCHPRLGPHMYSTEEELVRAADAIGSFA